jgi:hypothetical protein
MKIKSVISILVVGAAFAGLSSSAFAQPRPAPPLGVRPAPPIGVDPHRDMHDGHDARDDHREAVDHRDAVIAHQETEAQLRDRFQREHDAEYARRQAARRDHAAWEAGREERAIEARNQVNATWGGLADREDARAELRTHGDRMAQLNRILDVALDKGDAALAAHCRNVINRELARDARILANIRLNAGAR